ncbi:MULTISPECIES: hypothetical protein [Rhodobacterales]|uniref:hypothetical protein n=1 Tax=Rhodobacterales TaxID=204455 RepID=UPI0011BEB444|nr:MULTISPECIES: hypothetical protein [Rhodobacterales]MDO6591629.1 hypothetical protein [Yoonia sp. 1_MG-2023]
MNFIRRLNSHDWSDRNAYFNFIEAAGLNVTQLRQKKSLPPPRLDLLTDTMRGAILDDVAQTNADLATEFLGREGGILFDCFVPSKNEIVDVMSNDEVDAIMQAYDAWAPKRPKPGGAPVAKAKGKSAPSKPVRAQTRSDLFPTNRTLVAKAFGLAGRRMGVRKHAKLNNNPDLFFADMQGRGGQLRS